MLKSNASELFIDLSEYSITVAKTKVESGACVLQSIEQVPQGDISQIKNYLDGYFSERRSGYALGQCIVQPPSAFIHRVTLEIPAKAKNANYLNALLRDEYNVDLKSNTWHVLNGSDGLAFDPEVSLQRNLIFAGAQKEELQRSQDFLVKLGVYPKAMEMGSLVSLSALMDHQGNSTLPFIHVEIREDRSQISVINKRQIDMASEVPFGIQSIVPAVKAELSLGDEASARKLLFSNTFDFTEKGASLLGKLVEELQAAVDYFEVQTGQRIDSIHVGSLPASLSWIEKTLSSTLKVPLLKLDYPAWMQRSKVTFGSDINVAQLSSQEMKVLGLVAAYATSPKGGWS